MSARITTPTLSDEGKIKSHDSSKDTRDQNELIEIKNYGFDSKDTWDQDEPSPLLFNKLFWIVALTSAFCIPFGGDSFYSAVMKLVVTALVVGCILLFEWAILKKFSKSEFENYAAKRKKHRNILIVLALGGSVFVGALFTALYFNLLPNSLANSLGPQFSKNNLDGAHALFFQMLSFSLGYQVISAIAVFLAISVYLYYRELDKQNDNNSDKGKALASALARGFIFMGIAFGLNVVLHAAAVALAPSQRPIDFAGRIPHNIIAYIDSFFCGMKNPYGDKKKMMQNWPSGHTEWITFAAVILIIVAIKLYRRKKQEKNMASKIVAYIAIFIAGMFTLAAIGTGVGRYLGLAHTLLGVIGGAAFGIISALFLMKYILPSFADRSSNLCKGKEFYAVLLTLTIVVGALGYGLGGHGYTYAGMGVAAMGFAIPLIALLYLYKKSRNNGFQYVWFPTQRPNYIKRCGALFAIAAVSLGADMYKNTTFHKPGVAIAVSGSAFFLYLAARYVQKKCFSKSLPQNDNKLNNLEEKNFVNNN